MDIGIIYSAFALRASCQQKFYEANTTNKESPLRVPGIIVPHHSIDLIRSQIAGHHTNTELVVIIY